MPIYVVQVIGGEERHVCELISKIISNDIVNECFVPSSEVARHSGGVWTRLERVMFPGYVFVDTDRVEDLERRLREVPQFTRVLGNNGRCIPLAAEEVAWLNAVCGRGDRTLKMSEGVIEGGNVIILSGPLLGRTALIKKIDRHKRLAYVEVDMLGRRNLVKMGLEITRKTA